MPTSSRISQQPEDLRHDADPPRASHKPRLTWRRGAMIVAALTVLTGLGAIGWMWRQSLMPDTYSVMDMGVPDFGGGPGGPLADAAGHHDGHAVDTSAGADPRAVSVNDLTGPAGAPDVRVTLVARHEQVTLADGRVVDGFTLNGATPGPTLRARQGDLVQVTLLNESVSEGVTLHWHGVDVPNAEDGVAGVTQDAVGVGGRHVYRFVAADAGTYWYHSHNVAHRQVVGGLFGVLVIDPRAGEADADADIVATVHAYDTVLTVNGRAGASRVDAQPGAQVRLRVVNTDNGPLPVAPVDVPFRVAAIDGRDLTDPPPVRGQHLRVPAGGRADLLLELPPDGSAVRVQFGADPRTAVVLGPSTAAAPPESALPADVVDLLGYGSPLRQSPPAPALDLRGGNAGPCNPPVGRACRDQGAAGASRSLTPVRGLGLDRLDQRRGWLRSPPDQAQGPDVLPFDPSAADRRFRYDIGRRPGFVDGRPGLYWTINGRLFPDVPMFMVAEGDRVVMTLSNSSGEVHPMHLHGHHAVVLSRNGVPASGSPWWVDSLDVGDGETYEIAFVADNPGVWMDHCHNLPHAAEGLVAHLMYAGVTTPYLVGGDAGNRPE